MPDSTDERQRLIEQVNAMQHDLGRVFAHDRSLPFLASTLTMQQLKVILILYLDGPASGQALAEQLGVSLGTVTGIVDRLVARGLVARYEDPEDRRVRRAALTDEGKGLADEISDSGMARFRSVLAKLDTDTLRALVPIMAEIRAAAAELAAETRLERA